MIENPWKPLIADPRFSAPAPFARRSWIHPNAPRDDFDRVCEIIWSRTHLTGKGESSAQRPLDPDNIFGTEEQQREAADSGVSTPDEEKNKSSDADFTHPCRYPVGHKSPRADDENQKEKDDLFPETKSKEDSRADEGQEKMKCLTLKNQHEKDKRQHHTEFNLPFPSVSGCRCLHVAKPAQVKCVKENLKSGRTSTKNSGVPQASAEHEKNPEDPVSPFPAKLHQPSCQREHERDTDSSNDDDSVPLLGIKTCPSDGGEAAAKIDMKDGEKKDIPRFSECSTSDREQGILFNTETDFPQLPTNKAGITLCPTEPSTSRKVHSQWEIPFSFHPHHAPTASLASGTSAPVQAPIQGKELHANPATDTSPEQQRAYDLLADFPALQPPENPLALGDMCHGNPTTTTAEAERGPTLSPNHRQGSAVSHKRRVENVPREVSSICSGDQKSALGLETFGLVSQSNSPRASCEKIRANKQLPPTVAGTDGVGVNARSWASAAKAGMRQAAVPQEKARPCTFQHAVAISGAKGQRYPT